MVCPTLIPSRCPPFNCSILTATVLYTSMECMYMHAIACTLEARSRTVPYGGDLLGLFHNFCRTTVLHARSTSHHRELFMLEHGLQIDAAHIYASLQQDVRSVRRAPAPPMLACLMGCGIPRTAGSQQSSRPQGSSKHAGLTPTLQVRIESGSCSALMPKQALRARRPHAGGRAPPRPGLARRSTARPRRCRGRRGSWTQ